MCRINWTVLCAGLTGQCHVQVMLHSAMYMINWTVLCTGLTGQCHVQD